MITQIQRKYLNEKEKGIAQIRDKLLYDLIEDDEEFQTDLEDHWNFFEEDEVIIRKDRNDK